MDQRDELTWVAIELSPLGEQKVEEGDIASILRSKLGVGDDHPVFIPTAVYNKNNRIVTIHLMEGYAFVATGLAESSYFRLEKDPHFKSVMSIRSGPHQLRTLAALPNQEIESLRTQLSNILVSEVDVGSKVKVLEGKFSKMNGEVVGVDGNNAYVCFQLRSWHRITSIPKVFLEQT